MTGEIKISQRRWQQGWAKKFRIGRLYFYISNCRMKKRPIRDLLYTGYVQERGQENKRKLYDRQGGKCPHCGQSFDYEQMELHHILPVGRFPKLRGAIRNSIMLCHHCHKEVHMNPWMNIQMMNIQIMGITKRDRLSKGTCIILKNSI